MISAWARLLFSFSSAFFKFCSFLALYMAILRSCTYCAIEYLVLLIGGCGDGESRNLSSSSKGTGFTIRGVSDGTSSSLGGFLGVDAVRIISKL